MDDTTDESFEALLSYLRDSRGFDFTGYKRMSLMRRVRHRMDQAGYTSYEDYLDVPPSAAMPQSPHEVHRWTLSTMRNAQTPDEMAGSPGLAAADARVRRFHGA
jgi:hypothetical protein